MLQSKFFVILAVVLTCLAVCLAVAGLCTPQLGTTAQTAALLLIAGMVGVASAAAALWAARRWQNRLGQQVDTMIEDCHALAVGKADLITSTPDRLPDLWRLGMAIDVMRRAMVEYTGLYRRFYEAAPDMFLSLSPAGARILDANHAFLQKAGRLASEVMGHPVEEFISLDHGWDLAIKEQGGLRGGTMRTEAGEIKIEASISLERSPEGKLWVMGAILRDITDREALHRELISKSAALEQALKEIKGVEELKDQFLTVLSHELKTPLVSLKGFLQLLRQDRAKPEDRANYMDICWRNLVKLETQINNLLDLARLSHAKDQYRMEPLELGDLVGTEVENLRPLAQEHRIAMEVAGLENGPVRVRGNRDKLIQLVDNLLLNAVKYNKQEGEVRIQVAREAAKAVLSVSDSGVGISREQMAKIFNRFYRAEVTGTGRLEGLGIGLSLVQEIVRLHQGDIRVESEPGVGTTFVVELEALS